MSSSVFEGRGRMGFAAAALLLILSLMAPLHAESGADGSEKKDRDKKSEKALSPREQVADCLPPDGSPPPPELASFYDNLANGGNNMAILNCYTIACANLDRGNSQEAARLLDAAISRLQGSTAGDVVAKKSRKLTHAESEKNFRGEPYEQAMVFQMRGLIYLQDGDYENARACFRSAAFCDRAAPDAPPEEQYNADLALMDYLEGFCNVKLKADAADNFRFAREHARSENAVVEPKPDCNTLVIVYLGAGPTKFRTGKYKQELRFAPGAGPRAPLTLKIPAKKGKGEQISVNGPLENMTFQATTRGGREIDRVLKGKAQFKTGASITGDLLIVAGVAAASNDNHGAGAALGLVGVGVKLLGQATNPSADNRMLGPIPDDIYAFPLTLPKGDTTLTIEAPDVKLSTTTAVHHGGEPLKVVVVWLLDWAEQVNMAQQAKLTAEANSGSGLWPEIWKGSFLEGGAFATSKSPIMLLIKERRESRFSGALMQNVQNQTVCYPCTGVQDNKNMRIESTFGAPGNGVFMIMAGPVTNTGAGASAKGDYIIVNGDDATPAGKFELETSTPQTSVPDQPETQDKQDKKKK